MHSHRVSDAAIPLDPLQQTNAARAGGKFCANNPTPSGVNLHYQTHVGRVYPEWSDPPPGSPISQGDVLVALDDAADSWHQNLIVITADCDLANAKHNGSLSCVPVMTLCDYLLTFRIDVLRDRVVMHHLEKFSVLLKETATGPGAPDISSSRMREWLSEESPSDIVSTIGIECSHSDLQQHLERAVALDNWTPATVMDAVEALAQSRILLGDFKSLEVARKSMLADVAGSLRTLPGDALYINELSAAHPIGFVAYLRRVVEIADHQVSLTRYRTTDEVEYIRASRLRPPYVYALTQQFAAVFAAIGLPEEYEETRNLVAEAIRSGEI